MNELHNQRASQIIVSAALTKAGEQFIQQLLVKELLFLAVANSSEERQQLSKLGVRSILQVNTVNPDTWRVPNEAIGKVFLFESSLSLCCRYLRMIRSWTDQQVYVLTERMNARLIYRNLGADHILHTRSGRAASLLD